MSTSNKSRMQHADKSHEHHQPKGTIQPWSDLIAHIRGYVREEPEVAACVCLGLGFILGWKLKPW